jgi:hypothetical protein
MPLGGASNVARDSDWEQRQKHASFYQTQLNTVQQAACAAFAATTLLPTIGVAMTKLSGLIDGQDQAVLGIAVLAWLLVSAILATSFGRTASRLDSNYREEHATLFTGASPYRLESFLLDFANGMLSPVEFERQQIMKAQGV